LKAGVLYAFSNRLINIIYGGVITHQLLQNNIKNKYKYIMGCINKLTAA
jgi:hypothetical protein